jgi:hypothetical protein
MTTDPTTSPSPEPQDVREALADLVKWKDYKDKHGADATYELGKERAWRKARAALAQSDAEPDATGLIEAAEWRIIFQALRIAHEDGSIDNFVTDAEYETLKEKVRARAADRSGE